MGIAEINDLQVCVTCCSFQRCAAGKHLRGWQQHAMGHACAQLHPHLGKAWTVCNERYDACGWKGL